MPTWISTTDLVPLVPTTADHITFPKPAGLEAGDVLILVAASQVAGAASVTTSGWVTALNYLGDDLDNVIIASYQIDGSESSSMTVTFSQDMNSAELIACLIAYRGAFSLRPGDAVSRLITSTDEFACPTRIPERAGDFYVGIAHSTGGAVAFASIPGNHRYNVAALDGALCAFDFPAGDLSPIALTCLLSGTAGSAFSFMLRSSAPESVTSGLPATDPLDHIELAISRLPHMYRSGGSATPTNTEKVVRALLAPTNTLAAAMWDVLTKRSIDTAEGAQLTAIGKIVGRKDRVSDDEIERRYCRAQIRSNKSDGVTEDILTIARLVVDDPRARMVNDNTGTAAYVLRVENLAITDAVAAVLVDLIGRATSDGVRSIIGYTTGPIASQLRWGTGTWGQNWSRARETER